MKGILVKILKLAGPAVLAITAVWLPAMLQPVILSVPALLYPALFGYMGTLGGMAVFLAGMTGLSLFSPASGMGLVAGIVGLFVASIATAAVSRNNTVHIRHLTESLTLMRGKSIEITEQSEKYQSYVMQMAAGFSYQKVVFSSDGEPVDFIFQEVNSAFEMMTGLKHEDLVGKKVTEVLPGVADPFYDCLGYYRKSARSDREIRMERYYQSLNRTYAITIHSSEFGYFSALFQDITQWRGDGTDYKKFIEHSMDVVARFDRSLNCMYTNTNLPYEGKRSVEIIFGNLSGLTVHKDVQAKWEDAFNTVLRRKKEETVEMEVDTAGGQRYFDCRLIPEFSSEGSVESILCINRDNTAQYSAREDMINTMGRLKEIENIINASTVVVYLWLADTRWTMEYVSENIRQFGYARDDFIGGTVSFLDLIHPEDLERIRMEMETYRQEDVYEYDQEYRIRTADGEERLVKTKTWVRRNHKGDATHYQGMITDVTNIIQMPQYLIDSERKYREILDDNRDITFVLNKKGAFMTINREGAELLGRTVEELAGSPLVDLMPEEKREEGRQWIQEVISGVHNDKDCLVQLVDRKGDTRRLQIRCREVMESGGLGIAMTGREIAENASSDRIRKLSRHDKLTGLYNRAFFEEELERIQSLGELPIAVIVGDVDGLKLTNDAFGHKEGDQLLKRMADILKTCTQGVEGIFRLGGDEFAVILPQMDEQEAEGICSEIRELCRQQTDLPVQPSISLGAASWTDPVRILGEVLHDAEVRMRQNKQNDKRDVRNAIITSLQKTLEERTFETRKHTERMQYLAEKLGRRLKLQEEDMENLKLLCLLHDIGKIGIPDNLLMKSGRLTADEWEIMKQHPVVGYNIAMASSDLKPIARDILAHHENFDGTGYPNHLSGEEIPLIARILSVVDAYDAMTNDRSFHRAMPKITAIIEIDRCTGTQFDPLVVDAFKEFMLS